MKEFYESRIGKSVVYAIAVAIASFIIWPLIDLFFCNVIDHTEFVWNVREHIVMPIIVGIICGLIEFFWLGRQAKKAKKTKK